MVTGSYRMNTISQDKKGQSKKKGIVYDKAQRSEGSCSGC